MIARRVGAALLALLVSAVPARLWAHTGLPALQIVAAARIAAIANRVARSVVDDPERALAPAFTIADQSVPTGAVIITSGTPQINPTYVSVPIAITIDGVVARTVYAGYRITNYIHTAVAAHDLAQDAIVGADDVIYARVPFAGRSALDAALFIGRKVRAPIGRGTLLYPELTTVNEIVRAGMPAVLIVHDGPVALAVDVVARTSGGLGEYVTIYNPQTERALSGIVTGPNTVELTLPGAN